jgi:hypothetical protein
MHTSYGESHIWRIARDATRVNDCAGVAGATSPHLRCGGQRAGPVKKWPSIHTRAIGADILPNPGSVGVDGRQSDPLPFVILHAVTGKNNRTGGAQDRPRRCHEGEGHQGAKHHQYQRPSRESFHGDLSPFEILVR